MALGIGLGFNFDHMSELDESEQPSTRRLQARAAKSAIRRVQELFDAESASAELDKISDPSARDKKAAELRQAVEAEIQFLARRLSDLIPTDGSLNTRADDKVQQYDSGSFTRTSSHEYIMPSRERIGSLSLERLLRISNVNPSSSAGDDIDYLNPMGVGVQDIDDEFIAEWLKRYAATGNVTNEESDDSGDKLKSFLV